MSFVGKVLIVVQVVLSLCFMAFAGAVYVTQENWQKKHEAAAADVTRLTGDVANRDQLLAQARDEVKRVTDSSQQETDRWKREALNKTDLLAQKTNELNQVNAQKESILATARSKQTEAENREREAEVLRAQTIDLQTRVSGLAGELSATKDQLFSTNTEFGRLQTRYNDLFKKWSYLEDVVAKKGIDTDPAHVAAQTRPAPPVDGLVLETRLGATGRTQMVVISIGSDDGLRVGHELDVYRLGNGQDKTLYLGKVKIIDVEADRAVATVTQLARNGNIEVGDNVTTNL